MEDQREEAAAQPAKVEEFVGYQLWDSLDGELRMTLFLRGRMIEVVPDDETRKQAVGFYDLEHRAVLPPV